MSHETSQVSKDWSSCQESTLRPISLQGFPKWVSDLQLPSRFVPVAPSLFPRGTGAFSAQPQAGERIFKNVFNCPSLALEIWAKWLRPNSFPSLPFSLETPASSARSELWLSPHWHCLWGLFLQLPRGNCRKPPTKVSATRGLGWLGGFLAPPSPPHSDGDVQRGGPHRQPHSSC